ncbi:hypothetical protein FLJC2902T_05090 [Flavobacterium limnosediminis JC2902]|uniref:Uncharacterized protein n=1 Tax=Flavobacterium limnosediminis JC2902 TaxID=1341181 RepID=V6SU73_9FLAO|nr:hypothetical protein FLJC2902T_05090 [Flavobacterium limnosediminis JC2902]
MPTNFHKKENLEVLCRKSSIPSKAPTVPPTNTKHNSDLSEILDF